MLKVNGNPGANLAHMDTQRNSDLFTLTGLILETRKVDDSIDTLRNCISPLFQAFTDLRYRQEMERKQKIISVPEWCQRSAKAWNIKKRNTVAQGRLNTYAKILKSV